MTRIRENRYELTFGNTVGVLVDEDLMKQLVKIQYETREKILELLDNNKDKHWNYSWSITDEPKTIDLNDRTLYFIDYSERYMTMEERLANMFNVRKKTDVYDVGHLDWTETCETAEKEHTHHLKQLMD